MTALPTPACICVDTSHVAKSEHRSEPVRYGFFLIDGFPMIALSAAMEPFRAANAILDRDDYRCTLITEDGAPVCSSSSIQVTPGGDVASISEMDVLFVLGGTADVQDKGKVFAELRSLARRGAKFGAISGGVFLLADSGLLDGYRCSVHWYFISTFRERFPRVQASNRLYEIDRNRHTCSGGTATLDLMLTMMSDELGRVVSNEISSWFQHNRVRDAYDEQVLAAQDTLGIDSGAVTTTIAMFRKNIERPLSIGSVAEQAGLTVRHLERLFKLHLSTTPAKYYRQVRLQRARELLLYTNMPISEVAVATGFNTQGHFAWAYRQVYGRPPTADKKSIRRSAPIVRRPPTTP